jgi:hypothetical protein
MDDIIDPWNGIHADLSITSLSGQQKLWLGQQISSRRQTAEALSKRFNLKKKTLQWYGQRVSKGINPMGKAGRPKCLDNDSIQKCVDYYRMQNDEDTKKLRVQIRQAAKETVDRKKTVMIKADRKNISIRSVKRYMYVEHIIKTVHEEKLD